MDEKWEKDFSIYSQFKGWIPHLCLILCLLWSFLGVCSSRTPNQLLRSRVMPEVFFFACLKEILAILSFSGRAWLLTWTQVCSVYLGQKLVLVGSGPSSLLDIIIRIERDAHHLEFLVIKVLISFWKKEDSLFKSNKDVYCWISNNWISIYMNTS